MAISTLKKYVENTSKNEEKKAQSFIQKGGKSPELNIQEDPNVFDDHRLTLRIPRWLLERIDAKRKQRIGHISRNLWILERLDEITKK